MSENSESTVSEETPVREMSFLDHLEELRWCILKSLIAIVVGAIACFAFSGYILDFLTIPVHGIDPQPKLIFLSPTGMFFVRITLIDLIEAIVGERPFEAKQTILHPFGFAWDNAHGRDRDSGTVRASYGRSVIHIGRGFIALAHKSKYRLGLQS